MTQKLDRRLRCAALPLAAALFAGQSLPCLAADRTWDGSTGTYNNAAAWGGAVPTSADNAIVDSGTVQINAGDPDWTLFDIRAGNGAGTNGTYEQNGQTVTATSWFRLGIAAGATGTYTVNSGTLTTNTYMRIGEQGIGVLNINGGQVNRTAGGNPIILGDRDPTGSGSAALAGNAASKGTINHTGGTLTSSAEIWIGQGSLGAGVEAGTYNLSGTGTLNISNWLAIGRASATGVLNMTGGTLTKTGGGNIVLGSGLNGNGTINLSGGVLTNTASQTWLGENATLGGGTAGNGNGTLNVSGTGQALLGVLRIGQNSAATGTVNLDGGLLQTTQIATGSTGTTTFNFTGGTLRAGATHAAFLQGLTTATIKAGGARIDTNNFNIGIAQNLVDGDVGGNGDTLTKSGAGVLTLSGTNSYTGTTTVNGGALIAAKTASLPGWNTPGQISVATGAALGGQIGTGGFTTTDFNTLLASASYATGSLVAIDSSIASLTYATDLSTQTSAGTTIGLYKAGANNVDIDMSVQTYAGNTVISGGSLVMNNPTTRTYAGTISGAGNLTVQGAGDMNLTGAVTLGSVTKNGAGGLNVTGGGFTTTGNFVITGGAINQSAGAVTVGGELQLAQGATAVASYTLDAGETLNANFWLAVGRGGGSGTFNLNGGTINKATGGNMFIGGRDGGASTGVFNHNDGTVTSTNELWIGQNANTAGTAAQGTYNLANGTVNLSNWLAIAREGSVGTLNITGGTFNKTGGGNVTVGTGNGTGVGTAGVGIINQSAGTFNNTGSQTWLGESSTATGTSTGTYNLSGTGVANLGLVQLGRGGAASGTVNLNGGTMTATKFEKNSTGTSTFNFNGGTLKIGANETAYMQGLTAANVKTGGAVIDSNGFNATINQALVADVGGSGGLTKLGAGTLTLGGANTYTGKTTVSTGTLALSATGSIAASTTLEVQSGAVLDVSAVSGWTLASTQRLQGTGTVEAGAGNTITLAGVVAPGASPGTMTINGNVGLTGTYDYEYDGGTTSADLLDINGTLTLTSATLTLTDYLGNSYTLGDKFTLIAYDALSGTFTGYADDTVYNFNGGDWLLNYNDTTAGLNGGVGNGFITITAVPEPAAASLVAGLGLLTFLGRRRRA